MPNLKVVLLDCLVSEYCTICVYNAEQLTVATIAMWIRLWLARLCSSKHGYILLLRIKFCIILYRLITMYKCVIGNTPVVKNQKGNDRPIIH